MLLLSSQERAKYGFERIFNDSPDAPHFLSDSESGALAEVAEVLSTRFGQYEATHQALGTLGVVASWDARRPVRHAAANALQTVVSDHASGVRIRSVLTVLKKAIEAEATRADTDRETLWVLMTAHKGAEAFQKHLPIGYRPAAVEDARAMAELATREITGSEEDVVWRADRFHKGIEDRSAVALVAELQDEIVGMVYASIDSGGTSTLEFLAVAHQFSRGGGKLLHQSMRAVGDMGAREMELTAFGDMTQDYYRRFGFDGPKDEVLITMKCSLENLSAAPPLPRGSL